MQDTASHCRLSLYLFLLYTGFVCTIAVASAQPVQENWLLSTPRLTGDWSGARTSLEDRGIRFSVFYVHFYGHKNSGGLSPIEFGTHSGGVDLFGQFDFDKMGVIRGGEALIHLKNNWSRNINPRIGALGDPIDDADGHHGIYIDQLWYQQSSHDHKLQVRAGYLDQQTILDRNEFANAEDLQFMNTYLDNNNAIIPLAIGPGVAVFYNATDWLSFVVTASDAESRPPTFSFATAFDGDIEYFTYFETDLKAHLAGSNGPLTGNYRFGFFIDPRNRSRFADNSLARHNEGFYVSFDQMVYGEPEGDDQGLGLFFRYGHHPGAMNRIANFWSAGAQYEGLLPFADHQTIGFGMYSAIGSKNYRAFVDPDFDRETAYEVYYSAQLTPAFALAPGVQYVDHPGALNSRAGVWVAALRARISF